MGDKQPDNISAKITVTKKELRIYLNISERILARYLNELLFDELKKCGYKKTDKTLMPKQFEIVKENLL